MAMAVNKHTIMEPLRAYPRQLLIMMTGWEKQSKRPVLNSLLVPLGPSTFAATGAVKSSKALPTGLLLAGGSAFWNVGRDHLRRDYAKVYRC